MNVLYLILFITGFILALLIVNKPLQFTINHTYEEIKKNNPVMTKDDYEEDLELNEELAKMSPSIQELSDIMGGK